MRNYLFYSTNWFWKGAPFHRELGTVGGVQNTVNKSVGQLLGENHFPQDHPFCFCMAEGQTRCFQKMKTSCWKLLEDSEAAPSQTPPGGQPDWYANLICEALSGLWIDRSRWLCLDASSTIYRHALSLSLSLCLSQSVKTGYLSLSGNLLAKIRTSRKKLHKDVHAQQPWVSG